MKKKLCATILAIAAILTFNANAQSSRCATMHNLQKRLNAKPELKLRMADSERTIRQWIQNHKRSRMSTDSVVVIPTVVHVIWNNSTENVSDSQIQSQLDVMNADFRRLNSDTLDSQHPFWQYVGDARVEFCLAQQDPSGNPTNGITRTQTTVATWVDADHDKIKSTMDGGHDNWDPSKYLNLYVVNLDGSTLGFASFPDDLASSPQLDGVVIRYEAFGTEGTAGVGNFSENNGGRTATHEVGHWLNLRHIWGDSLCGDDFVGDTEPAEGSNNGCPTFPHRPNNQCNSSANGEMYMNYMDYVADNCMKMFTIEQTERMRAALYGLRSSLLTSNGCQEPNGIQSYSDLNSVCIYPNPNNGNFTLSMNRKGQHFFRASLLDMMGQSVKEFGWIRNDISNIDVGEISNGVYYLMVGSIQSSTIKKVVITK